MGLMSVRFGTSDVGRAGAFYDAIFAALGWDGIRAPTGPDMVIYTLPGGPYLMLAPPRNGSPATNGNGDTLGFSASDAAAVDRWHSAGITHGGSCEGEPGPREAVGGRYGAYLRDPDGHKLCAFAAV